LQVRGRIEVCIIGNKNHPADLVPFDAPATFVM